MTLLLTILQFKVKFREIKTQQTVISCLMKLLTMIKEKPILTKEACLKTKILVSAVHSLKVMSSQNS